MVLLVLRDRVVEGDRNDAPKKGYIKGCGAKLKVVPKISLQPIRVA